MSSTGPTANDLAQLFAATPHYRAIGMAFGQAKFRWHFGPMFYRGRTAPYPARVLIVGQEGAQDESLSHRSFTGGTGARMQRVLDRDHSFLSFSEHIRVSDQWAIHGRFSQNRPACKLTHRAASSADL